MQLNIEQIHHHRNGVSGAPFHVLIFHDPDEGRMLGIVFREDYHVAVFNLDKLAVGNITFGSNSWRGDRYEPYLRDAIAEAKGRSRTIPDSSDQPTEKADIDVYALVAQRRQIAIIWSIEDVQEMRPDLTDEQAWKVLQLVERRLDASIGVDWHTLECVAEELFGPNPEPDCA